MCRYELIGVYWKKKKKSILILGKSPTQELDDTKLTAEKKYSVILTEQQKTFWLSFHYNKMNSLSFDWKFNSTTTCTWNQKWNNDECQY